MSRSLTVVSFGLVLLSLQNVAGQQSFPSDKDVLSKLAVFEKYIYIGGGKNLYKLNANLVPEEIIPTCTSNCTNSVNQLLLINENEKEIVICGTGNDGNCSQLDLNTLDRKNKTGSLKVPVDPHFPAVGLVTEDHKDLMVARSVCGNNTFLKKDEYIIVIASWKFKTMNIPEGVNENGTLKYLKLKTSSSGGPSFCIKYQQVLEDSGFSYFFTNQNKYSNTHDTVSKVSRICQKDEYYQTYIDAEIACQVGGKSYNILTDAVLVNGKVFASFSKSDGLFESVICFKDIQQLNSSLVNEKLDFILGNCTFDGTQSYLAYDDKFQVCENPQNLTEITSPEFTCADIPYETTHNYTRVIGKTTIPFNYSDTNVEGKITKLFTTTVNQKSILLAGTESGHVIQYSVLEDGSLHKYDTSSVPISSSREDKHIRDLYHFPDGDALYALTNSKISKISLRSCSEIGVSVCTQSEIMKLKDPHCGWCVFKNKLSKKSECIHKWISSVDECITLSISPQGVKVGENTIDIAITSDSLPNRNFTCAIGDIPGNNEMAGVKNHTCSLNVSKFSANHKITTIQLYEETGTYLIAEAPFLFFNCSVYKKCSQCVRKNGAQCSWCPVQGVCVDEGENCTNEGESWINWQVIQVDMCPILKNNNMNLYIHNGQQTTVEINVENLEHVENISAIKANFSSKPLDTCNYTASSISCSLNYEETEMMQGKKTVLINFFYQYKNNPNSMSEFENDFESKVIVYDCGWLGTRGCNFCKALSCNRYKCHWNNSTKTCAYSSTCGCARNNSQIECNPVCPEPIITKISPKDGPFKGFVNVTVMGTELGDISQNLSNIEISGKKQGSGDNKPYGYLWDKPDDKSDFDLQVRTGFLYSAKSQSTVNNKLLIFRLGDHEYILFVDFQLKNSSLTDIFPKSGPEVGGTRVTLYGTNLGIGNKVVERIPIGTDGKVQPIGTNAENYTVEFTTKHGTGTLNINFDLNGHRLHNPKDLNFTYLKDPDIMGIEPSKAFLSGGTVMTVTGKDFTNANVGKITLVVDGAKSAAEFCEITKNRTDEMLCKIPRAPTQVKEQLDDEPSRKKRAADCDGCVSVDIIISLDGVEKSFTLSYYHDPSIYKFGDGVVLFSSEEQYLKIKGDKLDLVATTSDFKITIGVEECSVIEVKDSYMTCKAPRTQPKPEKPGQSLPEVKVSVGNIHTTVGYIQYKQDPNILIIAGASAAAAVFLLVMVITFFVCKYRKVGSKARALEKQLNNLELEIKHVAKEEFLDMQTSMSTVNRNLIEQGFPYHSYQQYACNVMFATDYLMSDPVVSSYKMSDELRARARTGMERFQGLLENKFFLVSLITTMEKQKHFFIKEKSNFAGNLCAIMMGRMDYMHEVLQVLITQLVEDPSSKRGVKSLFRRSESITEKLLSNWLSLCLYPHLKDHTGSLLYLLYIATRKTMEAGPIDALTNDAKYTLSEEKLLRKYQGSATDEETTDVKFEAKALTLNVVVDNGEEIYPCKALDCDTVNQVKAKCLDQIYVNYPASQLPVDPTELLLEWHAGFSGRMILRDKDNTSKRDGEWIRVNTLAHYAVADQSNMALVDPRNAELSQQEDYVNLAQIDPGFDVNSMGSDQPLTAECSTSHDEENPMELKQWHLLKDDDANKKEKSAIDELYLNRLITTKLSLVKYIDDLFSLVLESSKCPPPVKFLYDFLDDLAEKQKIDSDTLHAWKSHSYSIRVWAMLIKTPSILFDINAPSYVSESLDVISQVFIESFSRTEQAVSKESPTQKLIFRNELAKFRTHVQEFYKNVKANVQKPDELGQYLTSINRNQQETTFNKNAALYRLYEQIKPYTDEILDDLSICQETRCLQLNKKLEDIFFMMEE
ncbi:plexin-B2-like [Mya arenaria]|uniref:plexin-B2-like n=1 Tax=Mya arenaria TaxID=6604 RepID=UPI0022E64DCD|nr:plexin-B2-like [Mya arenaria]